MAVVSMNVPEKILLVLRRSDWGKQEGFRQAFIVDPSNRDNLNRAREWAREYRYEIFDQRTELAGEEVYIDNKDFKLTLLECASTSSQGGKLSFWNCLIEKDNIKAIIGIEQNNLLSMLKQSHLVNGTVQESLSLVKTAGTGGVVHQGMSEWQNSKQVLSKSKGPIKKTTKWELGKSYATLTLENLYMCDLYCWFEVTERAVKERNTNSGYLSRGEVNVKHYNIKMLDKPIKTHLLANADESSSISKLIGENNITTLSKLFNTLTLKINDPTEKARGYDLCTYAPQFEYNNSLFEKLPSREHGRISLATDNYFEELEEYIRVSTAKHMKMCSKETYMSVKNFINYFGYSIYPNTKPLITEEDKQYAISKLSRTVSVDFGDGNELIGTRQ